MINVKRYVMAGGTFAAALGIGFVMQNGSAQAPAGVPQVVAQSLVPKGPAPQSQALEIEGITHTAALAPKPISGASAIKAKAAQDKMALPDMPQLRHATLRDTPVGALPQDEPAPSFGCEVTMTAEPTAAAMVDLALDAPCLGNARLTIHHSGLMFTQVTSDDGKLSITVPALAEDAVFIAAFASGEGAVANTEVSSLAFYDRVAVQWKGDSGLQIHAREYDADYGGEGHVWAERARDMAAAARGIGGFITSLGDSTAAEPSLAEVYTFPTGTATLEGEVALSVEAEVTTANCGREVDAQTMQTGAGGPLKVHDLTLQMPACDAVGDFLVLRSLLNDLTVARN